MSILNTISKWVVLGFVFIYLPAWWFWDDIEEFYELYTGKAPMFDVSIEMTVGAEDISINRRVPCFREYFGEFFQYLFKPKPYNYRSRDLATGAVLKDGRAVLVTIPDICKVVHKARAAGEDDNLLPEGFLPVSAIADHPTAPQLIKVFVSRSYFERADAELKFKKYTLKPAPENTLPDSKDEFDWFRGQANQNINSYGKMHFENVMISKFPYEFYAKTLSGNPRFDELEHPINVYDVEGYDPPTSGYLPAASKIFYGSISTNLLPVSEPLARRVSFDHVIPGVSLNGAYQVREKDMGVLFLTRSKARGGERTIKLANKHITQEEYSLSVRGHTFTVLREFSSERGRITSDSTPIFYDPKTRHFYYIKKESVQFPVLN